MKPLKDFVGDIRSFLEPIWVKAHEGWADEPVPTPPSKYMCRYSCLFLKQVLNDAGYGEWQVYLGRPPSQELHGTAQGQFGYQSADGKWYDHAWLIKGDTLIDITADQYGDMPVIVCNFVPEKYHANMSEADVSADFAKLKKRVDSWVAEWQKQAINSR